MRITEFVQFKFTISVRSTLILLSQCLLYLFISLQVRHTSTTSEFKSTVSFDEQLKVADPKSPKTQMEPTAKEKRRFFKKSSSVDSPVISTLAKASVQAQPAAPSLMRPSDIFKAVKQKLRPTFKKTRSFDSSSAKISDGVTTPSEGAESPLAGPSSTWPQTPDSTQDSVPSAFQPVVIPDLEREPERGHRHRSSVSQRI